MITLEKLARQVVRHWEKSDLQVHVRELARHLKEIDTDRRKHAAQIKSARYLYTGYDIEIDDKPLVSSGAQPGGAFVNAWIWIGPLEPPEKQASHQPRPSADPRDRSGPLQEQEITSCKFK